MAKPAIFLSSRFLAAVKDLNAIEVELVEDALRVMPDCFGRPHVHSGISIRRLRKNLYECRAGLRLRLLFREKSGCLEFFFLGDHNQVKALLRNF